MEFNSAFKGLKELVMEGGIKILCYFFRGNAIQGAPSISGTSQLPNPPIIIGMTLKRIVTKAWAVTMTL
jgi:hypothetical protein